MMGIEESHLHHRSGHKLKNQVCVLPWKKDKIGFCLCSFFLYVEFEKELSKQDITQNPNDLAKEPR